VRRPARAGVIYGNEQPPVSISIDAAELSAHFAGRF
jgi:ribosomal protein L25 (general stress protein Ctc)